MWKRIMAAFVAVLGLVGLGFVLGAPAANAADGTYYYGPKACNFNSILTNNWAPVRLVVQKVGTWRHVYRYQVGSAAGQANSEVITDISLRELHGNYAQTGATYHVLGFAVKSWVSPIMGTGYSPWIAAGDTGWGEFTLFNEHGDKCIAAIQF